jgi:hypothetical protein
MKKIMTMMLGLASLAGTVGVSFAQPQEPPKQEKRKKKVEKGGDLKREAPKKKAM